MCDRSQYFFVLSLGPLKLGNSLIIALVWVSAFLVACCVCSLKLRCLYLIALLMHITVDLVESILRPLKATVSVFSEATTTQLLLVQFLSLSSAVFSLRCSVSSCLAVATTKSSANPISVTSVVIGMCNTLSYRIFQSTGSNTDPCGTSVFTFIRSIYLCNLLL